MDAFQILNDIEVFYIILKYDWILIGKTEKAI